MRIQSINNTNFKGLFTNKTYANNGEWRMEYSPYSWELKANGEYGMSPQKEWSIIDHTLPDNEKRFVKSNGRESCKDILGTEFYYCDYNQNSSRKVITETPAMNLQKSLEVRNSKLEKLLDLKDEELRRLERDMADCSRSVSQHDDSYWIDSRDYDKGFFDRSDSKDDNKRYMDEHHRDTVDSAKNLYSKVESYIYQKNSVEKLNAEISKNKYELDLIKRALEDNSLIDISRRDIYDPNKVLWEALQNVKDSVGKLILLPHRTMFMKDLINKIGSVSKSNLADEGIKIIDKIISSRC